MNSLTALAHTAAAAPAFNSPFYTTAALLIPVLFLAIAVQGPMYDDLLKAYLNAARRLRHDPGTWRQKGAANMIIVGTGLLAAVILFFGILGEIQALIILYQQSATGLPPLVPLAAIGLTILVGAGPAIALRKANAAYSPVVPPRRSRDVPVSEPQEEQHEPPARTSDTTKTPTAEPETTPPDEAAPPDRHTQHPRTSP